MYNSSSTQRNYYIRGPSFSGKRPIYATPPLVAMEEVAQKPRRPLRRRIPYLPPEILAEIVGFVLDEKTLKALASTARVFERPAQKKLFSEVTVMFRSRVNYSPQNTPQKLYAHLQIARPQFLKLIQSLIVGVGADHYGESRDLIWHDGDEEARICLHETVRHLTNLKVLTFPRYDVSTRTHRAKKPTTTPFFPPLSREQVKQITELDISAFSRHQFPSFAALAKFVNLKRLKMCFNKLPSPDSWGGVSWAPPLTDLTIIGGRDLVNATRVLRDPTFPIKIKRTLVRLRIEEIDQEGFYLGNYHELPKDLQELTALFDVCREIREFRSNMCSLAAYSKNDFVKRYDYPDCGAPPNMSRLLALETIILEGTLEEGIEEGLVGTPVAWMIDLLGTVSPHAPVCDIQLRFEFPYAWRTVIDVLYSQWSDLAKLLFSGRFPRLKRIMIRVHINPSTTPDPYFDFRNFPGLVDLNARGTLDYGLCIGVF